jgi:ketosteroid isomerase-like protein
VTDSANLDLVRSIYADWERGEFGRADWADPEIECSFIGGPSPGSWTGLAAMAAAMRDSLDPWTGYRAEVEEYRELDGDRVLTLSHATAGRGKRSGLELEQVMNRGANLFHIQHGKVTRLLSYWDRDRALADLGLSPEGDRS